MTKPRFFDSTACRSGVHCETCRNREHGRAWREKLQNAFRIPKTNFDCPHSREWNRHYPVPKVVNQCALAESTGLAVGDGSCNCGIKRFLCHWPRYRAWCEARQSNPRARNPAAGREFLSAHPMPKRTLKLSDFSEMVLISMRENLGLVTGDTCARCPGFRIGKTNVDSG